MPEPLASVGDYLRADLNDGDRDFVPTAELVGALAVEPTAFGRQMGELGCRPRPGRVIAEDGTTRQARGYLIADIRAAIDALRDDRNRTATQPEPVTPRAATRHNVAQPVTSPVTSCATSLAAKTTM